MMALLATAVGMVLLLCSAQYTVTAFVLKSRVYSRSATLTATAENRDVVDHFKQSASKGLAQALVISSIALYAPLSPAIAAVGEGDLPPGALAYNKVVKFQVSHYHHHLSLLIPFPKKVDIAIS